MKNLFNKGFSRSTKVFMVVVMALALLTVGQQAYATLTIAVATISSDGALTLTTAGAFTLNGVAGSVYTIGAATTTGTITIGGTAQTGSTTIRSSTAEGTTSTSGIVFSADAVTTGTAMYLTADALTTGEGFLLDHATTVIADGGSLLRLASATADTGGATNGTLLDIQSAAQLAGTIVRLDNILTTGTGMSIIGTGIMTTTGNLMTITGNSATTAAGLVRINANGLTSGIGEVITSSSTGLTGAGRLLRVDHTGNAGDASGVVAEIASAAADETTILRVTGSAALALGNVVDISAAAMTTGTALDIGGMAALTTGNGIVVAASGTTRTDGMLISLADASTAATSTGRMLLVNHTGNAGVSTILSEFASAAADETEIVKITSSAALAAGKMLNLSGASMTTGTALAANDLNALTTGIGAHLASSATAITGAGRLFYSNHTGATGTTAILNEFASSATDETNIVKITSAGMIDGVNLLVAGTTGMTTGSLIRATSSTAGAVATNGIISLVASGIYTSTSNAGFVNITANATTAGTVLAVNATGLVDGVGIYSPSAEAGLTTGSYMSLGGGKFTVQKFGATTIAGSAAGTAALTLTAGDIVASSGSATVSTFMAADAFRPTNYATIAASAELTKANLQSASFFPVDTNGGAVDVDLVAMDAGDVGRELTFYLIANTPAGAMTVTSGTGMTVITIAAGVGATEDAGDLIKCTITTTAKATCLTYGAD
ncbi:MAG: hypothetical protein V1712_00340 [Patescibacteria group bacterium]